MQRGHVFRRGKSWYGRWREDAVVGGRLKKRHRCVKLAEYGNGYRTESDVQVLLDEKLAPLNSGRADARSTMAVAEFGENLWLPWVEENCKLSTADCYKKLWKMVKPRLEGIALRDFRTVNAATLLRDLHAANGLGRNSLKHIKSLLSGMFTLARNLGVLDTPNPIQGTMLPKKAAAPAEMHAATIEEVLGILAKLETGKPSESAKLAKAEITALDRLQARVAVALTFFAGLRPGEARGARWEDFDGATLTIRQSVWHTHTTEPKTAAAKSAVPVIEPLKSLLEELRRANGNAVQGPILRGPSKKPLNLDNLSRRIVQPILAEAKLAWHGWYAMRRGIATAIAGVSKDPLASKGLLRHTTLATTAKHYIKDVPENTLSAMKSLETVVHECSTTSEGRPN